IDDEFSFTLSKSCGTKRGNEIRDWILNRISSVKTIDYLDNDEYDEVLTSSIVFLDVVDCSASNAIVECISRLVPILVNRHPAVVEYLGDGYPLYFDSPEEIPNILTDEKIIETSRYMTGIRHTISIDNFLKD